MKLSPSEILAKNFLMDLGFNPVRFSESEKRGKKTPDFKVFKDGLLLFYCEVKLIEEDSWLDNQLSKSPSGNIVGGARPDPTFNKISKDIRTAVKQFNSVNPDLRCPNVLIFINQDDSCTKHDLIETLTGNFYAESGSIHPISKRISEGKIKEEKNRINLYIWFQNGKPSLHFNNLEKKAEADLANLFKIDPSTIYRLN